MKESIRAALDSLLIAGTSVVVVVAAYTLSRPDRFERPEAAKRLDPASLRTIVLHRTDCPDFRSHSMHFIIGNGVLYGDGEVVETEAWTSRAWYPWLSDPAERRRTAAVGLVLAGRDEPTAAQREAVRTLERYLKSTFALPEIKTIPHDIEGCTLPVSGAVAGNP